VFHIAFKLQCFDTVDSLSGRPSTACGKPPLEISHHLLYVVDCCVQMSFCVGQHFKRWPFVVLHEHDCIEFINFRVAGSNDCMFECYGIPSCMRQWRQLPILSSVATPVSSLETDTLFTMIIRSSSAHGTWLTLAWGLVNADVGGISTVELALWLHYSSKYQEKWFLTQQ